MASSTLSSKTKKVLPKKNPEKTISSKVTFSLTDHHKVLIPDEKEEIQVLVSRFAEKIGRSKPITVIQSEVTAYFNKQSKITGFQFHFHVHFEKGEPLSATVEDKVLWTAVKKSMEKVRHQLKRNDH